MNPDKGALYIFTAVAGVSMLCFALDFLITPFRLKDDAVDLGMIVLMYWLIKWAHQQYLAGTWIFLGGFREVPHEKMRMKEVNT